MENVTAGARSGSKAHGGLKEHGLITGDQVEEHGCRSCPLLQKSDPQTLQRQVGLAYLGVLTQAVEEVAAVLTGTHGWEGVRGVLAHFWQKVPLPLACWRVLGP